MNKDETFTEKILNSPLFAVFMVSFYGIVSLFLVLFDNSSLIKYFTGVKFSLEIMLALVFGFIYGFNAKKQTDRKYVLSMLIYFIVLNFIIYLTLYIQKSDIINQISKLYSYSKFFAIALLGILPFILTLAFWASSALGDFENLIKNKSDIFYKLMEKPLCTVLMIYFLSSILLSIFFALLPGFSLDILFMAKTRMYIEPLIAVLLGLIYGIYYKKAPDFKYTFSLFSYSCLILVFSSFDYTNEYIWTILSVIAINFFLSIACILLFGFSATIVNLKQIVVNLFVAPENYQTEKQATQKEGSIIYFKSNQANFKCKQKTPFKTALDIGLWGSLILFLPCVNINLISIGVIASFAADFICAFICGIIYGSKQKSNANGNYLIRTGGYLVLLFILRNILYFIFVLSLASKGPHSASLGTIVGYIFLPLVMLFLMYSLVAPLFLVGIFKFTNYITYGIKNR